MRGKRKKGGGASSAVRDSQKRESSSKVDKGGKPFQQQKLTFDLVDLDDPVSASQGTSFTSTQAWRIPNRNSHSEAVPLPGTSPRTGDPSCVSGDVPPGGGGVCGSDAGLWVERFAPKWEDELAVHRKKVQEVSQWFDAHFGPPVMHRPVQQSKGKGSKPKAAGAEHKGSASGKESSWQQPSKVLALVGPPGCGKTALVHVVAAARGVTVQDWQAPVPLLWDDRRHIRSSQAAAGVEHQEKLASFSDFIRSSRLFSPLALSTTPTRTSTTTPAPTLAPPEAPQPSARSPPPTASPTSRRLPSTMPPPSRPPLSGKRNKASLSVSAAERQTISRGRGAVQRPEGVREGRRGEKTGREKAKAGGTKGMEGNSEGRRSNSVESWECDGEKRDGDEADEDDGGDDEEWLPLFREASDAHDDAHGARGKAKEKKQVVRRGSQGGSALGAVVSGRHVGASAVPSSPLLPPSPPALPAPPSPSTSPSPAAPPRHVLLIDDLPFVSGRQRCDALCHAMHSLAAASHVPAVVVLSLPTASTTAASSSAPGSARGGMRGEWRQGDGVPTRDVLDALMSGGAHKSSPKALTRPPPRASSPFPCLFHCLPLPPRARACTTCVWVPCGHQVEFNPIAPGAMHKVLAAVAAAAGSPLAAPAVAAVADSSAGDLRHAISQLQLLSLSTRHSPSHTWDPGGAAAGGGGGGVGKGGSGGGTEQKEEGGKRRKKRKVQPVAAGGGGSSEVVDLTCCESSGGGEAGGVEKGVLLRRGRADAGTAGTGGKSGGSGDAVLGAGRDDPLSLFHAVGKFLHNKRLPAGDSPTCLLPMHLHAARFPAHLHACSVASAKPMAEAGQRKEHEWVANPLRWQQWGQPSSQQVITGDSQQCAPGPDAPIGNAGDGGIERSGGDGVSGGSAVAVREELQRAAVDMEAAEVVIQRSQLAPMKLCCYLHENMLDMLHPSDGLEAAVGASAALSDALTLLSSSSSSHLSSWSGGGSMAADGMGGGDEDLSPAAVRAAAAASVAARGVMFWNTQPAPKRMATATFAPAVSANLRQGCPSSVTARSTSRLSSSFLAVPLRLHASASRAVVAAPHRRPDVRASFGAPSSGALTPELKSALDKFITENKVILFMKGNKQFPQCGFSNTCVQILNTLNVPFETVNILEDDRLRQGMKEYSSWPTFPQLYIDGEFYGGCDITIEGFQSGELKETIEKALLS
ncbi:unnamed protein product [Closterium sp. Naga37s-1]|nr:unnamed protein product [Closterium sp. Naga37s-1]